MEEQLDLGWGLGCIFTEYNGLLHCVLIKPLVCALFEPVQSCDLVYKLLGLKEMCGERTECVSKGHYCCLSSLHSHPLPPLRGGVQRKFCSSRFAPYDCGSIKTC